MKTPLLYLGERVQILGAIIQAFRDPSGDVCFYKGIQGLSFGDVVEAKNGKLPHRPKVISFEDLKPTAEEEREFEAQKIVVRDKRVSSRKALALKKPHPDIVRAAELLGPFYRAVNSYDRARFLKWFENELSKNPRKKRR